MEFDSSLPVLFSTRRGLKSKMANSRKVQGDIDKLVKKIGEGIESYEDMYDKFVEAQTQVLKERFEGDLKKEIKKLQRLREQIKLLMQSPEVKDKKVLEQSRRLLRDSGPRSPRV